MANPRFVHDRVKKAEYRIRKMRNKELWSVTEYYDNERCQLAADELTYPDALTLAQQLSNRQEF